MDVFTQVAFLDRPACRHARRTTADDGYCPGACDTSHVALQLAVTRNKRIYTVGSPRNYSARLRGAGAQQQFVPAFSMLAYTHVPVHTTSKENCSSVSVPSANRTVIWKGIW
jgi:hypothetical protein